MNPQMNDNEAISMFNTHTPPPQDATSLKVN